MFLTTCKVDFTNLFWCCWLFRETFCFLFSLSWHIFLGLFSNSYRLYRMQLRDSQTFGWFTANVSDLERKGEEIVKLSLSSNFIRKLSLRFKLRFQIELLWTLIFLISPDHWSRSSIRSGLNTLLSHFANIENFIARTKRQFTSVDDLETICKTLKVSSVMNL